MNIKGKYEEDLLRLFINPKRIEKAPEGFTSKVMTRIQIESGPLKTGAWLRNKRLVPVISAAVTILLILAAFLLPGNEADAVTLPVVNLIKDIKLSLPEIDFTTIFRINLPALLIYVFIGILILTIFDRALIVIFRRGKSNL